MTTATQTNVQDAVREYMGNSEITVDDMGQVRMESTHQTLGMVLEGEDAVINHLRILCMDNGNEWNGIDRAELYDNPRRLSEGLTLIDADAEIWYQRF